jgi:hypothetical protein
VTSAIPPFVSNRSPINCDILLAPPRPLYAFKGPASDQTGDLSQEEDAIRAGAFAHQPTDKICRTPSAGGEDAIEDGKQGEISFGEGIYKKRPWAFLAQGLFGVLVNSIRIKMVISITTYIFVSLYRDKILSIFRWGCVGRRLLMPRLLFKL